MKLILFMGNITVKKIFFLMMAYLKNKLPVLFLLCLNTTITSVGLKSQNRVHVCL